MNALIERLNLRTLLAAAMEKHPEDDALGRLLGCSKNQAAKIRGGTAQPPVGGLQTLIEQLIDEVGVEGVPTSRKSKSAPADRPEDDELNRFLNILCGRPGGEFLSDVMETVTNTGRCIVRFNKGSEAVTLDELDVINLPKEVAEDFATKFTNLEVNTPIEEVRLEAGGPIAKVKDENPAKFVRADDSAINFIELSMPSNRDINLSVMVGALAQWRSTLPEWVRDMLPQFHFQKDTLIHHARNLIASRFLAGKAEWLLWLDSDIIAPFGDVNWFLGKTKAKKIADKSLLAKAAWDRLTSRKKTLVGAVYCERNHGGRIINSIGLSPKDAAEEKLGKDIAAMGPVDKLHEVSFLGFGCVATHRSVFEDIIKTCPEVHPKAKDQPYGFFNAFEDGPTSEDVAFCKRAAKAGHPSFLDRGVFCGHVGNHVFMP